MVLTGNTNVGRIIALRIVFAVLCSAALLIVFCTDETLVESGKKATVDNISSHQILVENSTGILNTAGSSPRMELRQGVIMVASDGGDFRAVGLTETITDLETGQYSKPIEVSSDRLSVYHYRNVPGTLLTAADL